MRYKTIAALLLSALFAGCSSAGPMEGLEKAANSGDITAQTQLAEVYLYGLGDERKHQDPPKAIKWLKLAAEQGDIPAHNLLATIYMCGKGIPKDIEEGLRWLTRAAELGDSAAQNRLSSIY